MRGRRGVISTKPAATPPTRSLGTFWSSTIMTFTGRLSSAGSQTFASSRRSVLGKFVAVAVATVVAKRSHKVPVSKKYPLPDFNIGDVVAYEWVDEFETQQCEVGEVVGICWHPINCQWEYHINWTSGSMPSIYYPCFDGHLACNVPGARLRLV